MSAVEDSAQPRFRSSMKPIIAGPRNFHNYAVVFEAIAESWFTITEVEHGFRCGHIARCAAERLRAPAILHKNGRPQNDPRKNGWRGKIRSAHGFLSPAPQVPHRPRFAAKSSAGTSGRRSHA